MFGNPNMDYMPLKGYACFFFTPLPSYHSCSTVLQEYVLYGQSKLQTLCMVKLYA